MNKFLIIIALVAVNVNLFAQKRIKYQGQEYSLAIQKNELDIVVLVKERFPISVKMNVLSHFKEEDIPKYVEVAKVYKPNPENKAIYDKLFKEYMNIYKIMKKICKRLNPIH